MQSFLQTIIIRHRKENLKKCSLRGLEKRSDILFLTYPKDKLPDLKSYVVLSIEGPVLSEQDRDKGLLLLDGTWRYAQAMSQWVDNQVQIEKRSLPSHFKTAYPRRQSDCIDPERGLASVEALYAALALLGREEINLLENYYWREAFLAKNNLVNYRV